jgi:hypothetical protein
VRRQTSYPTLSIFSKSEQQCPSSSLVLKLAPFPCSRWRGMTTATNTLVVGALAVVANHHCLTGCEWRLALTEPRRRAGWAPMSADDRLGLLLDVMLIFACWSVQVHSSVGGSGAAPLLRGGARQQGGRHLHVGGWGHGHRAHPWKGTHQACLDRGRPTRLCH